MDNTELLEIARHVAAGAYAPYSNFMVGAAVLMQDGTVVTGSNQECASYSLTICAERVALASAFAASPSGKVAKIAIFSPSSGGSLITPCGACREYMAECARRSGCDIEVITETFTLPLGALLPHPFEL